MSGHEAIVIASFGVIVASVAVLVTFVGVLLSNRRTKDSNDLMKIDLESRIRPWLKFNPLATKRAVFPNHVLMDFDFWNQDRSIHPDPEFIRLWSGPL